MHVHVVHVHVHVHVLWQCWILHGVLIPSLLGKRM